MCKSMLYLLKEIVFLLKLQNSQKKRGARPNNKPDKKPAPQVIKHVHTSGCSPEKINSNSGLFYMEKHRLMEHYERRGMLVPA